MLSVTENPAVAQVVSFYLRHNDWFAARFLGRFHQWLTKNGPGNSRATSSSSSSSSFLSAATEDPAQTRKRYREEYQHSSVLLLSLHSHALSLRLAVASIHACDLCSKSLYGAGYQCDQCTFDLCLDCFDATTSAPMSTTATTTTTAPAASAISNLAKDASSVARPSVMPGPEMPSIEDTFHALKQDMLNGLTRISNIDRHEYVLVKNCLDDRARFAALAIKFIDLASRMIDKEEQQKEDDSNGTDPKQSGNAIKKKKYLFANKTLPEISDASSSGILRNKKARFDVFNNSQTKSSSKATPTERKMDMYQHQDDGEKTEQELKNADEEGGEEEENVEALFEEDSYRIVEVALTGMTSFLQVCIQIYIHTHICASLYTFVSTCISASSYRSPF